MATAVTVSGTLRDGAGNNLSGTITFTPSQALYDTDGNLVVGTVPVVATLSSGTFSVTLYATDDANTSPSGATYTIEEALTNSAGTKQKGRGKFKAEIPSASGTLRYEDITEAVPASQALTSYATSSAVSSLTTKVNARKNIQPDLIGIHSAVAHALTSTADVVVVGDSITELEAYYLSGLKKQANEWLGLGDVDPPTYRHPDPNYSGTGFDSVDGTADTTAGLGGQAYELTASSGEAAVLTFTGDACEVVYTLQSSNGAELSIVVTDPADTTVTSTLLSTTDASVANKDSGNRWSSGLLGWNRYTVTCTASGASGTVIVDGIMEHRRSLSKGIRWWNAGHNGWGTDDFVPSAHSGTFQAVANIDPDAVVVFLGTNDFTNGLATWASSDYPTVLDELETASSTASLLLVAPYAAQNRSASGWSDWAEAVRVEAASRGAGFVDLYDLMGDVGSSYDTYALSDDGTHPSAKGANVIAAAVADRMLPRRSQLTLLPDVKPSTVFRPEGYVRFHEDFVTTMSTTNAMPAGWNVNVSGSGSLLSEVSLSVSTPGVKRLSTGTTSSGYTYVAHQSVMVNNESSGQQLWRVRVPTLPDGTDTFTVACGLVRGVLTEGVWFGFEAGDANWGLFTANGSTTTKTDTGQALSTDWIWFRVVRAPTYAALYMDGTAVALTASTLPTGSPVLTPQAWVVKSTGTSQRFVDLDVCNIEHEFFR